MSGVLARSPPTRALLVSSARNFAYLPRPDHKVVGTLEEFSSQDDSITSYRIPKRGDVTNRFKYYTVLAGTSFVAASTGRQWVHWIISSLGPPRDALALATVEVDLKTVPEGTTTLIKWQGKPVFIRHRTQDEIQRARADDKAELRDPAGDVDRFGDSGKYAVVKEIGRAVQQECRDRSRMPSSA
eukprot:TRINITY_DN8671_c0_g1_i3.p1 TRINITY_DN8671_c0_g1~~TRINITY_DN8671_c0_g1_i3.p1  ORF type:complete len:185 (-),score=24.21 TRINITY_DN8671_c0_g1_i3:25-579(-)